MKCILLLVLFLAGCTVGPDYHRPLVVVPCTYKEAKNKTIIDSNNTKWKPPVPCDTFDRGNWWTIFRDPTLNELEEELNHLNQNVMNAAANYRQALAVVDEARASFFPTLDASYTAQRQKNSGGSTSFVSNAGGMTSTGAATGMGAGRLGNRNNSQITTTHTWLFNASWELDVWGAVHRTVEANIAAAQSSKALYLATRLSAQASLAQIYFELRTADADQRLLDITVREYKKALKLTRNQYKAGVAARSDVIQAQSQLETAQAQAIENRIIRAQFEHAIAVLIGRPPAMFSLVTNPIKHAPPPIPVAIPSELLERRPDVAQAERLMAQANAEIGVAISAYFPTINLTGVGSSVGRGITLTFPNFNWTLAAQIAQTLLDGGLRRATLLAARAQMTANVAAYRQVVLDAFQEVEDNLVSLRVLKSESAVQQRAARDALRAARLVTNQYRAGIVPYTNVLTAQTNAYTAERTAIDIVGRQWVAAVNLVKALGGGWDSVELTYCF